MDERKTSQGFAKVSVQVLKYVIMVVVAIVCATTAYNFGAKIFSVETMEVAPGTDMSFTFEEGTSIKEVGDILEEYRVIKDADIFSVQSYVYSVKEIVPGTYLFNTSQTSEEIFKTIAEGPIEEEETTEE